MKYIPSVIIFAVGLTLMYVSLSSGRIWIWIAFCIAVGVLGLSWHLYRWWRIPSDQRRETIRGQVQNFRDYMVGKHDTKN